MINASIPVRHIDDNHNVPMYITNIDTVPAGSFYGKMVVSMRPVPIIKLLELFKQLPDSSSAWCPYSYWRPSIIGIKDINAPDLEILLK